MAMMRWGRTSAAVANQLRGSLFQYRAGYKSLVSSFDAHKQFFLKDAELGSLGQRNILLVRTKPYLVHKHGFARMVAANPHNQRQIGLKVYHGSSGTVIDPYHVQPRYPFLKRWFTREGWQQIKESLMRELRTAYAVAKLRHLTGFKRKQFYSDVEKLYKEINRAIAEGNRNALKLLVTENMLSVLKNEIKKREGIWDRVDWNLVSPVRISTLQARAAALDPNDHNRIFIQLTVKIKSIQTFGAFDRDGKLVAGEPLKELPVEDIWVVEIFLGSTARKFRLCGRITL